ncbi:MAG: hypothetical protein OXB88_02670 [Bacteriovoracales bacterium]|nr:hypothetical protein [Bacteriovoracales bacterium]
MDRLFFLVFHGGLVGYLILHNVLIPAVKHWKSGLLIFGHIQYYFLPHLILLLGFIQKIRLFGILGFNLGVLMASLVWLLYSVADGISTKEFSIGISLTAIIFFFFGFFIYFKKFFTREKYSHLWIGGLIGLLSTGLFYGIDSEKEKKTSDIIRSSNDKKSSSLTFNLPSTDYQVGEINILDQGFQSSYALYPEEPKIILSNQSAKSHLIRIEYMREGRWHFKRIFKIARGQKKALPIIKRGIYRLRSPSSKELKILVIVIGSNRFKKGTYMIDIKGLRIIN